MATFFVSIATWSKNAWLWLKKYWSWLLFPVGIALFLLTRKKATPDVVAPELVGASETVRKADDSARVAEEVARGEMQREISEIDASHDAQIAATDASMAEAVKKIDDPKELNDYLLETGKKMRDKT